MSKNIERLEKQLFYTGFSAVRKSELEQQVNNGKQDFTLSVQQEYGTDATTATLNFRKSDKGNYFFNSFDLEIKKEGEEESQKQNFRVNFGNTFTLKEAYNMMSGRAVNKDFIKVGDAKEENKVYNAWAELDFTEKDRFGNHPVKRIFNFNIDEAIKEYPVKLPSSQINDLLASLKKGNRQSVPMEQDGKSVKMYVEANPRFRTLKFYDEQMNPILLSTRKEKQIEKDQGQKQGAKDKRTANNTEKATTRKSNVGKKQDAAKQKAAEAEQGMTI